MKILLFIISIITTVSIYAQQQNAAYYYDGAGNRIRRELCAGCVGARTANPNDSTISNALEANILPNPTKGDLVITVTETTFVYNKAAKTTPTEETHFHVIVYDLYGREILNEQHNSTKFKIDITQQPPGAYFVKLFTANKVKHWEIIKE